MTVTAHRMRTMRARQRSRGLREMRLVVPDPRLKSVQERVAVQSLRLDPREEEYALRWIEAVLEFDEPPSGEQ